ncbi:MAG: riboflavin biosynthesis protein RibF [Bacteroidales bacterium]
MVVLRNGDEIKGGGLAATIGFFDGVHLGHRFLIRQMIETARVRNLSSAVITFPVHPKTVLQPGYRPELLHSFEEKIERLSATGIDYCILLDFTMELSRLTAGEFMAVLSKQWRVKTLLVGYDHRFGRDRTDGFEQYLVYAAACGMEVLQIPCFKQTGEVGSSEIRKRLALGKVEDVAALLACPYQIKGHIISGYKVGRTLGFPTANIRVDEPFKALPAMGVYAVKVLLQGIGYNGMLYIGRRPTLNDGNALSLEVNIFGFSGDAYHNEIVVSFIHYIRGDIRFNSLNDLKKQLEHDRKQIRELLMIIN